MEEFICSKCGENKPANEFYKSNTIPRGYTFRCKKCISEDSKKSNQKPRQKAMNAYNNIYWRSENRDKRHPQYANVKFLLDKEEFLAWAVPAYSNYAGKCPTIDRINPDGHYEISNIQLIEAKENSRKARRKNTPIGIARLALGAAKLNNVSPHEVIREMKRLLGA